MIVQEGLQEFLGKIIKKKDFNPWKKLALKIENKKKKILK